MPRFIVERTFPAGLAVPMTAEGAHGLSRIVAINADKGVTWVARLNKLPVESITEVTVLDPYFYH